MLLRSRRAESILAPLPAAQRGKPTLIGGDPQGENILYCLGNDVIIRSIQVYVLFLSCTHARVSLWPSSRMAKRHSW